MNLSPNIRHNVPVSNTMNHEFRLPESVIIILKLLRGKGNLLLFILSKKQKHRTKHLEHKQKWWKEFSTEMTYHFYSKRR